jgi:hypothetical protein
MASTIQVEQIFIKECINQDCEFQDGCRVFDKNKGPQVCEEPCIYCGSPMKWFIVEEENIDET